MNYQNILTAVQKDKIQWKQILRDSIICNTFFSLIKSLIFSILIPFGYLAESHPQKISIYNCYLSKFIFFKTSLKFRQKIKISFWNWRFWITQHE